MHDDDLVGVGAHPGRALVGATGTASSTRAVRRRRAPPARRQGGRSHGDPVVHEHRDPSRDRLPRTSARQRRARRSTSACSRSSTCPNCSAALATTSRTCSLRTTTPLADSFHGQLRLRRHAAHPAQRDGAVHGGEQRTQSSFPTRLGTGPSAPWLLGPQEVGGPTARRDGGRGQHRGAGAGRDGDRRVPQDVQAAEAAVAIVPRAAVLSRADEAGPSRPVPHRSHTPPETTLGSSSEEKKPRSHWCAARDSNPEPAD